MSPGSRVSRAVRPAATPARSARFVDRLADNTLAGRPARSAGVRLTFITTLLRSIRRRLIRLILPHINRPRPGNDDEQRSFKQPYKVTEFNSA